MKTFDLSEILGDHLLNNTFCGNCESEISGVCVDSREVKENNVFVAITGVKTDGHMYIPKAVELGASAVVCENEKEYEINEERR